MTAPTSHAPLLGLAHIMRRAYLGDPLVELSHQMIQRIAADGTDANAMVDLSTILQMQGVKELALRTLDMALQTQRVYELPSRQPTRLRLLALMAPGDLMVNAPLPFLIEDADIALTMLYLLPGEPLPAQLPPHDLSFIAIPESSATHALLEDLSQAFGHWPTPVLLHPAHIMRTSRLEASHLLAECPGVAMPHTVMRSHAQLLQLGQGQLQMAAQGLQGDYPVIVRPLDSHAGHGLEKIDDPAALLAYAQAHDAAYFYLSPFVDYRSSDGQYRKYRVVLIDGQPFAGHMGISDHWMIHYLNAGMEGSAAKRAEEQAFMDGFDTGFAQRHAAALQAIGQRLGLEYLVMDVAETRDGALLVFEVDPGAVVHSMDHPELFPYKVPAMQKVFAAFRALLLRRARIAPPNAL